jgi:hypothetical protein
MQVDGNRDSRRGISELKEKTVELASIVSRGTSRKSWSSGSQVNTVVALKHEKAQAVKASVKYAEEENPVLRRKTQQEQETLFAAKQKAHIERSK